MSHELASARLDLFTRILVKRTLKAYLLGHITDTGPGLFKVLLLLYRRRLGIKGGVDKALTTIQNSLAWNKFPTFCATLFALYTILENVFFQTARVSIQVLLERRKNIPDTRLLLRFSRVVAGLTAGAISFRLLNAQSTYHDASKAQTTPNRPRADENSIPKLTSAGRTLDFTILISVRALEALIGEGWRRYRQPTVTKSLRSSIESAIGQLADPAVFMVSAGVVMWAWIYNPQRLPPAYQKWIGEAASIDPRLVQALQNCRKGEFFYGKETGQGPLLKGMCEAYNVPTVWGDPAKTIPLPCEIVHMGTGPSCHYHALSRFARAFKFSFLMYLPIQLLVKLRRPSFRALVIAVREAARSATFLGSFIGLFYYSICLARTVLGPRLFDSKTITPQMWDGGLCIGAGCVFGGASIFVEKPQRRPELAFFVAPRAAAVFLPRRYDIKYLWREQLAFSVSAATLLAMIEENPASARGLVSFVLSKILA